MHKTESHATTQPCNELKLRGFRGAADLHDDCCSRSRDEAHADDSGRIFVIAGTTTRRRPDDSCVERGAIALQDSQQDLDRQFIVCAIDRERALVLSFAALGAEECVSAIVDAFAAIPAPASESQQFLLIALMLDVAVRLVRSLHRRVPPSEPCSCRMMLADLADELVDRDRGGLFERLTTWLSEFGRRYRRAHRPSRALEAAALIRENPTYAWTGEFLAKRTGCKQRTLAHEFRSLFGLTIHQYLGASRLSAVFDRLGTDEKISGIAGDAGYRSPKDFYRVVRECTDLTPHALHLLPPPDRSEIKRMLEAALADPEAVRGIERSRARQITANALGAVRQRVATAAMRMMSVPLRPAKATLTRVIRRSK